MSFRNVNETALDVVRQMKDDIDQNERDTGAVRQNTIRLGNWILGAVGNRLNFTRATTTDSEASNAFPYGGRQTWSYSDLVELDEYVDGQWIYPPHDIELVSLQLTLQIPSNVAVGVATLVQGEVRHATAIPPGELGVKVVLPNIAVPSHARYWPRISPVPGGTGEMLGIIYDFALI